MPHEPGIRIRDEDGIRILTIHHPPVNALSGALLKELDKAVQTAADDDGISVLIVTGSGQTAFVAGADIREIALIRSRDQAADLALRGQAVFDRIERSAKPVIAAINGVCLGGGNELALACHLRVASERARFGQPEINLGIIPGFGGTQRLLRLVGTAKAVELVLTGDLISAREAERIGLITRSVPDGEELKTALGLARRIASKGRVAVAKALQAFTDGRDRPLKDALKLEASLFAETAVTEDMKEGVQAFLEKRQPRFKNR